MSISSTAPNPMSNPGQSAADRFLRLRREALGEHAERLGIDFVEVLEDAEESTFKTLVVHFVPDSSPGGIKHSVLGDLEARNFHFSVGGVDVDGLFEIQDVRHRGTDAEISLPFRFAGDADLARRLGEAPEFVLELIEVPDLDLDLDPFFSRVAFSLELTVPPKLDCEEVCPLPVAAPSPPWIDYLARDYDSFRRLMLDHLGLRLPNWRERSPADQIVTLVEVLADAADQVSYAQDAVATEGYLETARQRISVRRHARLVDYRMHEGTNARLWAVLRVNEAALGGVEIEPGLGTLTSFGTVVTGTGTAFTAELKAGDPVAAGDQTRSVIAVRSDTLLDVDQPFDPPLDNVSFRRPGMQILTRVETMGPGRIEPESGAHTRALQADPVVFETAEPAVAFPQHNEISLYTWGADTFSLPIGATCATLAGSLPDLRVGQVVILEEVLGRQTGEASDADVRRRWAVRLTAVELDDDPLGGTFLDPSTSDPVAITNVAWHADDALPFPLCVATVSDGTPLAGVTVARGNVVLADHGRTVGQNRRFLMGTVASSVTSPGDDAIVTGSGTAFTSDLAAGDSVTAAGQSRQVLTIGSDTELTVNRPFDPALPAGTLLARGALDEELFATDGRFRPRLARRGLTHRTPFDPRSAAAVPAVRVFESDLDSAMPVLDLRQPDPKEVWRLEDDLLSSDRFARHFVVETENDGSVVLRFGDGDLATPPDPGTVLHPVYRVGNGRVGNVGPESLAHVVTSVAEVIAVRNPLAGRGGVDPEALDDVRRAAPGSLRKLETCTTEQDFVRVARTHPQVERAVASLRWTGSWHRMLLAIQRTGGQPVDDAFRADLAEFMEGFRIGGWELTVEPLRFVGLDIALTVFLEADRVAGAVEQELLNVFGNQTLRDGRRGFFHPDNFGFGESVYLSRIVETTMAVPGVRALDIDGTPPKPNRFRRFGEPPRGELANGQIRLSGLEIARVDNDPTAPENGSIRFFLEGGR